MPLHHRVESAWGAVSGLLSVRFARPLHKWLPGDGSLRRARRQALTTQGIGIPLIL